MQRGRGAKPKVLVATLAFGAVLLGMACASKHRVGFDPAAFDAGAANDALGFGFESFLDGRVRATPTSCECNDKNLAIKLTTAPELATLTADRNAACLMVQRIVCGFRDDLRVRSIGGCAGPDGHDSGACLVLADSDMADASFIQADGAAWDLADATVTSDLVPSDVPLAVNGTFFATATPRGCGATTTCAPSTPIAGTFRVCVHYESVPCE